MDHNIKSVIITLINITVDLFEGITKVMSPKMLFPGIKEQWIKLKETVEES